jgi:transposase InsO family protein
LDHGKVFISAHITNACAELGISLQPARKYTATDKAPIERFFEDTQHRSCLIFFLVIRAKTSKRGESGRKGEAYLSRQ